eukprot:2882990-Rhodomonas_salina.1
MASEVFTGNDPSLLVCQVISGTKGNNPKKLLEEVRAVGRYSIPFSHHYRFPDIHTIMAPNGYSLGTDRLLSSRGANVTGNLHKRLPQS